MKVVTYLRVSTEEQARHGNGLQDQKQKSEILAAREGELLRHFIDDGYSGALEADNRPALKELMQWARTGKFDVLVVPSLDRLGRDTEITIKVVKELLRLGIKVRSVLENFNFEGSQGALMLAVIAGMADSERLRIKERTMGGRATAARSGKWVYGRAPFGYRMTDDKKLEVDEERAETVRLMYKLLLEEGKGLNAIKRHLDTMNVPTPARSTSWQVSTIHKTLLNPVYTGKTNFRKFTRGVSTTKQYSTYRPEEDWIPATCPPIITVGMHEEAKRRLSRNRMLSARKTKEIFLYSGLIVCNTCGWRFRAHREAPKKDGGERITYMNGRGRTGNVRGDGSRCQYCGYVREDKLDELVWGTLVSLLTRPETILKGMVQPKREGVEQLASALKSHEAKLKRVKRAFLDLGAISEAEFLKETRDTEAHIKELQDRIQLSRNAEIQRVEYQDLEVHLKKIGSLLNGKFSSIDRETKREVLVRFVDKVVYDWKAKTVELVLNVPQDEQEKALGDTKPFACISAQNKDICEQEKGVKITSFVSNVLFPLNA